MSITRLVTQIIQMTHSQKKWFSLTIAVAVVGLALMLTGSGNKEAEQATASQKATNEAAAVFMRQGNGHVRKSGDRTRAAASALNVVPGVDDATK
ncbi:MAG: hypothetical protein V4693_12030 [Pseudomonadota bacterium]